MRFSSEARLLVGLARSREDRIFGLLSRMAKLSRPELHLRSSQKNRATLSDVLRLCKTGQAPPENLTPDEFAQWLYDAQASVRDWSRALGDALLRAQELASTNSRLAAVRGLQDFAKDCPWSPFGEIAIGEIGRLRSSEGTD